MSDGSPIGWLNQPGFGPMTGNVVLGCRIIEAPQEIGAGR